MVTLALVWVSRIASPVHVTCPLTTIRSRSFVAIAVLSYLFGYLYWTIAIS